MNPLEIPHRNEKKGKVSKYISGVKTSKSLKNFSILLGRSKTLIGGDCVGGLSEGSHSSGDGNLLGFSLENLPYSCDDNDGHLDNPLHCSLSLEEGDAFEGLPHNSHPSEGNRIELNTFLKDAPAKDKSCKNDATVILNNLKVKHLNKPIIGHININFLENKFEPLLSLVKDKIDIFMISETKLDDTFPFNQFSIEGYSQQFRRDRNKHGEGIRIFII